MNNKDGEIRRLFERIGNEVKGEAPTFENCWPTTFQEPAAEKNDEWSSIRYKYSIAASIMVVIGSLFFWPSQVPYEHMNEIRAISEWTAPTDVFLSTRSTSLDLATWINPTDIFLNDLEESGLQMKIGPEKEKFQ